MCGHPGWATQPVKQLLTGRLALQAGLPWVMCHGQLQLAHHSAAGKSVGASSERVVLLHCGQQAGTAQQAVR